MSNLIFVDPNGNAHTVEQCQEIAIKIKQWKESFSKLKQGVIAFISQFNQIINNIIKTFSKQVTDLITIYERTLNNERKGKVYRFIDTIHIKKGIKERSNFSNIIRERVSIRFSRR